MLFLTAVASWINYATRRSMLHSLFLSLELVGLALFFGSFFAVILTELWKNGRKPTIGFAMWKQRLKAMTARFGTRARPLANAELKRASALSRTQNEPNYPTHHI